MINKSDHLKQLIRDEDGRVTRKARVIIGTALAVAGAVMWLINHRALALVLWLAVPAAVLSVQPDKDGD